MLTKWIIDGRKKPWPTSELFVGYDSHESVRRGQKLRPRLVHASIARGIIAIGNTEADGVRMLYTIGSVDQIKRALVELALEDKSNDEESFNYDTEDISDVEETADSKTNEVTVLNAYNVFSDYHIDYTAQRLDFMQMREVRERRMNMERILIDAADDDDWETIENMLDANGIDYAYDEGGRMIVDEEDVLAVIEIAEDCGIAADVV